MRTRARRPRKRRKWSGLRQRALDARRGDLERVALAHLGQRVGDALAELERDAVGMVDEDAQRVPPTTSASSTSTSRLALGEPALDLVLECRLRSRVLTKQKKWASAHFRKIAGPPPAPTEACGEDSTVTVPEASRCQSAVEACLETSGAPWRRVAHGEWGLAAQAGGWPLHVGLALRGGLLARAGRGARPDAVADAAALLHRNRRLVLVRFAATRGGRGVGPGRAAGVAAADEPTRSTGCSGC